MDKNNKHKVNIINGSVVGVFLGKPMQDATPDRPEDNEAYATERNTQTTLPNSNTEENLERQPEPTGGGTGPIDPKRLPEGYPYKEQSEIVFLDITCTESGNYNLGDFSWLEAGKTYTVQLGNETFEIMAEAGINTSLFGSGGNYVYLGCTITTRGPSGDYPFSIYRADNRIDNGKCVLKEQPAEPIKIKVLDVEKTIHRIDPEYLPEGYPYEEIETIVTFSKLGEEADATLYAGTQYIVEIDGVEYETQLVGNHYGPVGDVCYIGTAMWETANTPDMPFSIYTTGLLNAVSGVKKNYRFIHGDNSDHDVKVYIRNIVPMSEKFMPSQVFIIDDSADDFSTEDAAYGDKVKEAILSGKTVYLYRADNNSYGALRSFGIGTDTTTGVPTLTVSTYVGSLTFVITTA